MTRLVQTRSSALRKSKSGASDVCRVIAYCRVSTDDQEKEGVSLDAQVEHCRGYAKLYGLDIVRTVKETASAKSVLARPLLLDAVERIKKGEADGLLVMKLDRLTRSVRDIGNLVGENDSGVKGPFAPGKARLFSVAEQIDTANASGRLVLNVLSSVSQWEREAIGERTSAAMQHMKAAGCYTGGHAPFGMQLDGERLAPNKTEKATLTRARKLYDECENLHEVSRRLAAEGRMSRSGKPFDATQIRRMCFPDFTVKTESHEANE